MHFPVTSALFLLLILISIAGLIWAGNISPGPRKGKAQRTATLLFSSAFFLFGLANLWQIKASQRFTVQGTLENLHQSHGKSTSSTFCIVTPDGHSKTVHSDYAGGYLREGQRVTATALDFEGTLLHLKVLEGPFIGWEINEHDGTLSALVLVAIGIFSAYGGYSSWKRDPNGLESNGPRKTPINGVDPKSILNLSGRLRSVYKARSTRSTATAKADGARPPRGER